LEFSGAKIGIFFLLCSVFLRSFCTILEPTGTNLNFYLTVHHHSREHCHHWHHCHYHCTTNTAERYKTDRKAEKSNLTQKSFARTQNWDFWTFDRFFDTRSMVCSYS
jgi:hypothetical protein